MKLDFDPAEQHYLNAIVEQGYCQTLEEAIRKAVRQAREQDEARDARLAALLAEGEADVKAGRYTPFSDDLMASLMKEAKERVAAGYTNYNPDVVG